MMEIETEITILVNRKSDIDLIKQKVIESKIQFPVYVLEYENLYQINFTSNYEEYELESAILDSFPDYEFTTDLGKGRKEIRLQLSRYQSELSTDGWGRPIENPLDETKYLIKKSEDKPEEFNSEIKVLFGDSEQRYYVNIIDGINKTSGEKGFLLLNEFKAKNPESDIEFFKDRLYKSSHEAFHSGRLKMQGLINQDFDKYLENKKKEQREQEKVPRKIVRDFISSCNNSENTGILKNLDPDVVFEKRVNWKQEFIIEGINEFEEYINSPNQELCSKGLKIRSSWNFHLPSVTIGIKYYPTLTNQEMETSNIERLGRITFVLTDNKITHIIKEY